MIIKVCGMTCADNIAAAERLGVDIIGMVFYPKSPRYVKMIRSRAGTIPDYSQERLNQLRSTLERETVEPKATQRKHALRAGVFVDDMPQNIITRVYNYQLNYIQLHGTESRICCENLKRTIDPDIHKGIRIIKAIPVAEATDIDRWQEYQGVVDMLLFDTRCKSVGGSGKSFDWKLLERYDGNIPFLLSGGIGPGDEERIRTFKHPQFAGIDLNSKFETKPGIKDITLLSNFISNIRHEQD